jgi:2-dehydro-3-deoxyphosphooctonate aldolase (KDO 8-P synthase)
VVAAAKTGKAVNIKKGQFVAPKDMLKSIEKVTSVGNVNAFVTERGTTFGYNNLVVDMRAIPMIQESGIPVVFDATHSVQLPSAGGAVSGGLRQYIPSLTKAAIAAGAQGLFMEVHPNPDKAKSDGATQIPLAQVKDLLSQWLKLHTLVQTQPEIVLPQQGHCVEPALVR